MDRPNPSIQTITVVTHSSSPLTAEYWKALLRRIQRHHRGPHAVLSSLTQGISSYPQYRLVINPPRSQWKGTVHVLAGIEALKEAITLKKQGVISKLIAGPTLVVTPHDHEKILCAPEIDLILQPSDWVRNFYISQAPELTSKIHVWPAGVSIPSETPHTHTPHCLVYYKNNPALLTTVQNELHERQIPYTVLTYGSFKQKDFYRLLEKSEYMIYLSESESQGIALTEAWIRNVPTLVWDRGFWKHHTFTWQSPHISCPYLTPETGMTFKNETDFPKSLDIFFSRLHTYTPRTHSLLHHTDIISTATYLDIIKI